MGKAESEGVVVVLGDPTDMERDYLNDLQELTDSQDTAVWKVPSGAMVGDLVLVYLMAPVSAIVAHATVLQDPVQANAVPDREWGDGWWAELGYFGMVDSPITNAVLRSSLPRWKWPAAPRSATLPKGEAALDLVEFIEQRVPTVLEDRLGDDLLSLERNHVYQVVDIGSLDPGRFAVTRIELISHGEAAPAEILQVLGSVEKANSDARPHCPWPRSRCREAVRRVNTSPDELRSLAVAQMRQMLGPDRVPQAGGPIDSIVAYVDWYARSKAVSGWFNAQQFALWRLFQTMVPTANDSDWDRLRSRVTNTLETSGTGSAPAVNAASNGDFIVRGVRPKPKLHRRKPLVDGQTATEAVATEWTTPGSAHSALSDR